MDSARLIGSLEEVYGFSLSEASRSEGDEEEYHNFIALMADSSSLHITFHRRHYRLEKEKIAHVSDDGLRGLVKPPDPDLPAVRLPDRLPRLYLAIFRSFPYLTYFSVYLI